MNLLPTLKFLQEQRATVSALASLLLGLGLGLLLRHLQGGGHLWRSEDLVWLALPGNLFMRALSSLSMPLVLPKLNTAIGSTGRHLQPGTRQHIYGKFCSKLLKNLRSLSKVVIVVQPSAALAQLAKFALGELVLHLSSISLSKVTFCVPILGTKNLPV